MPQRSRSSVVVVVVVVIAQVIGCACAAIQQDARSTATYIPSTRPKPMTNVRSSLSSKCNDLTTSGDIWQAMEEIKLQFTSTYELRVRLKEALDLLTAVPDWMRTSSIANFDGLVRLLDLDLSTTLRRPQVQDSVSDCRDEASSPADVARRSYGPAHQEYRNLTCQQPREVCAWITSFGSGSFAHTCKLDHGPSSTSYNRVDKAPFCRIHSILFTQILMEVDHVAQKMTSRLITLVGLLKDEVR